MDTKFSSAIHMLILISEAKTPMSSEKIAESVGTNPSYIRKIAGLLKKAGIIESSQGRSGFSLTLNADELTLYQIFCAVEETSEILKKVSAICYVRCRQAQRCRLFQSL